MQTCPMNVYVLMNYFYVPGTVIFKVEFDLAVNTSSNYYAKSKGEQIALNVDGPSRGDQGGFYRR